MLVPTVFQSFYFNYTLYRVFSHDVTAAVLVSENNETAAMLVSQTNPVGVELFLMETLSFIKINLHRCWPREWKRSMQTEHFWNRQQTIYKCFIRWKIPQNQNVGAVLDSKLQNGWHLAVLLQFTECILVRFYTTKPWAFSCSERLIA